MTQTQWECTNCSYSNRLLYGIWNCAQCDLYNPEVRQMPQYKQLPAPLTKPRNRFQDMTIQETIQYYRDCILISEIDLPDVIVDLVIPYIQQTIGVGCLFDACDRLNQWAVSVIRDVLDDKVLVHYVGWDSKYDDWISISSERLRPW